MQWEKVLYTGTCGTNWCILITSLTFYAASYTRQLCPTLPQHKTASAKSSSLHCITVYLTRWGIWLCALKPNHKTVFQREMKINNAKNILTANQTRQSQSWNDKSLRTLRSIFVELPRKEKRSPHIQQEILLLSQPPRKLNFHLVKCLNYWPSYNTFKEDFHYEVKIKHLTNG